MNLKKWLRQKLVYWPRTGTGPSGPTYGAAVELACRWSDNTQEVIDREGRTITSTAHILTAVDMVDGSFCFEGTIAQWKRLPGYPNRPTFAQGGRDVFRAMRTPDKRGRPFLFEFYL